MSNQVVPFESAKLPAFLASKANDVNDDLTANVGAGFPVLSIKGKTFTVKRGKEATLLTRELDGEKIPAQAVEVVLLKANKNFSKTWYVKGYTEGSDAKPDCFSNDGETPDPSVEAPQSKKCATCPKNVWGSKISDDGSKLKACTDVRRLAIAPAGQLNDPMLLRVPPASLKPLAEYGQMLKKRGVPYNAVITKIKFDPEAATPKLQFAPVRFLTEEQYAESEEAANSELVQDIIGVTGTPMHVEDDATALDIPGDNPAAKKPATEAAPAKPKKSKPVVTVEEIAEVVEETPAASGLVAAEEAPAKPAKKPEVIDIPLEEDLDNLLASLDD